MNLSSKTIAVFLEKFYDEREFIYPTIRLREAGATVIVTATDAGKEYPGKTGYISKSEAAFKDINPDILDGVIIPGGYAPDHMRRSEECLNIVRKLHEKKKMIAYICHAGWVPISAGIVKGSKATSVPAIKDDMLNAGVIWIDEPVVVDGHFITAQNAELVGPFMKAVVEYLSKA